jgi:Fe-S-cluster containining protein
MEDGSALNGGRAAPSEGSDESKRHPLRSGIPCRDHGCHECCIRTRMPLSQGDIERIRGLGHRLRGFAVKVGGEWRLRNSSGRCVFLSGDGCRIYPFRPEGCRLYPLVYDDRIRRALMDGACRHGDEFEVTREDVESLMGLLKRVGGRNRGV